ncbi:MAG TPA: competence/damage-inducible protein A [Acidimicrobiales bacterium]|nr:competence/damage-inducible protein A [Acidimicrobiales bacterium]
MRVEIVAVGTELLLGQIADTNSAWMGEQLAAAGIDSHFHQAVGDNQARIVLALRTALARGDAVIVCGGLGPTQDDITREAIAEVMNVALHRDEVIAARIAAFFGDRQREMTENNLRQADVPEGAIAIDQVQGTAPGLICPLGAKVLYAVPGVPHEMAEMFERGILPDLRRRSAEAGEEAVIVSRVLRTWGTSESALAAALQDRFELLDRPAAGPGTVTIAFLASGIEGIKVRLTARAGNGSEVTKLLDAEEQEVRRVLAERLGDIVFGLDDTSMEQAVADLVVEQRLTLGLAESMTGGLIASRLVSVPGASTWFRGAVVSYASEVKFSLLGVAPGPVVAATAAEQMAEGARRVLGADVALAITGVAGPDEQDGQPVGTVFVALALPERPVDVREIHLPGDRERIRQYSTISALDVLRRALLERAGSGRAG